MVAALPWLPRACEQLTEGDGRRGGRSVSPWDKQPLEDRGHESGALEEEDAGVRKAGEEEAEERGQRRAQVVIRLDQHVQSLEPVGADQMENSRCPPLVAP
eukprot:754809-Hanusia_phi.AAC.8